ncbi:hemicentin-1-like [Pocillopora verrucosa]|uniref:hemicentin-1-like n=1 Tax=Pocillopora verrucosa TaxID=203993 RepID=UPI003340A002
MTIHPEGKTPIEGENMTLSCNATGNPEPSISWVKDGFPISSDSRISFSHDYKRLTITYVNRMDSGEYRCVARNRVGNDTSNSKVNVLFEPEVTIDGDQEQYMVNCSSIRLICRYEASPPVSEVQWIKEGTLIAGNTSVLINDSRVRIPSFNESQIQLSITAASLKDGGNYTCRVTNILNSTQDTIMIIIKDKPEIATHPQNITTREGQRVTLYCNATGNPAPTISWYKNGYPINNSFSTILSPSHEQLTIRNVNRIDRGDYTCRAKNRVGTDTSNASTINVQFLAEIVSHPQANVTKEEGSNLTLFCNATGNPAPIILWTKDGSPIINNSRIKFSTHNRLLSISNVNREDSGHYRCVANNSLGNDTSNFTTVDIQYKPEITTHPRSMAKKEGKNVTFFCNATANPLPTTSWTKDGSPITNYSKIILLADNKVLTITNVSRKDRGKYRCVVSNKLGNDTAKAAALNVKYRPEITKHPQNVTETERNNVTLTCNATGNPEPQFSWFKDKHPVIGVKRIYLSANNSLLTITDVNRNDSGGYLCVAHNEVGNDISKIVVLDVQYRPALATQPQNDTSTEGKNVTLTCNATGNPEPVLSWFKDENLVKSSHRISFSADNKLLKITNVYRTHRGKYLCLAHNEVGNASSKIAILNIQYEPEIITDPSDDKVKERKNVTLYCHATGNPLPAISWKKDGYSIGSNSRISYSAKSNELTIINVYRTDSGKYHCVASNSIGNASSVAATLVVEYRPEITKHPQNVTETERNNVTLTCSATGNPEPQLSWFKDKDLVESNDRIYLSANNSLLTITDMNRNDSGGYLCVAHNEVGNDTSIIVIVDVQYEPEIIIDPSDDKVKEGKNRTLYCNATGNPLPAISWKKDGYSIGSNSRISYSGESNELTIINVYRTDSGKYHCVASNSIGNASSDAATLVVEYKSEITTHPSNVTNTEGENVMLHCNATGYPLPTLSWTKNGSDISNTLRISFSADKKQLAITKASRVDSGAYRCVATNSLGNDTSIAAVVDVQFQPEISIHPRNVTIVRGNNVTLRCSVVGNPTPSVVWTKDKDLDVTANSRVTFSSRNDHHSLEIARVYLSDSGQYRCVANNSKGRSSSSAATLTVQYVPDPPKDVKVISGGSRKLNISWTAGFNRNSAIQNYTVEISEDRQTFKYAICQGTLLVNGCVIYATRVSIKELFPWTTYYLRVFARNMIGSSNYSSVVNVTTDEEVPSSAPPLNVTVLSSTAVNVSWQMLTKQDAKGAILGYYILYKRKSEPEASWKNRTVYRVDTTSLLLVSLDEYKSYQFAIQAFNRKGVSGRSEIVERETDEGEPSRGAENVSSSEVNYTTNRITWAELPKETANGVIKLYEVRLELKESCSRVDFTFYAMNTTKTSVLLTGIWMCAKYEVSVRGYTVAGPGPFSKAIVVQTKSLKLSQTWSKETPSPPSFSQIPSGEGITANITLPRFPGNAKFFQVIVIRYSLDYTGVVNSPESFTPKDLMTYEEAHKSLVPAAYVTFQFRGQDFDAFREFVVGDGENSSSKTRHRRSSDGEVFLNKPLQPNTNYRVFLRAFIEKMVYFSSNFVTIETRGEPAVKDLPERTIFQVGDVVVLTCEATGDPKPSVTWSKDGNTSIPRAQFRNDDHILVIQEVAPSDGGIYECRASNIFGQRRTATAVIIAVPPSIMKDVSPRSVLCAKETSCSLLCHATSDIPFNYSWTRNGQALDGHNIKVMNNSVVITPLDDQDFGDYVCHATNSFGSTTYKITLSESREEGNNVQSIFRANDIAWSCIVFVLLVLIGVLIWRLRRAQASNRPATAKKATIRDTVQSVFPLEQHASEPASYMELRSRPSEGQTRVPPEYQSLQGSHVNAGYYNVVPEEGNKRGPNEEIYDEIELSDC